MNTYSTHLYTIYTECKYELINRYINRLKIYIYIHIYIYTYIYIYIYIHRSISYTYTHTRMYLFVYLPDVKEVRLASHGLDPSSKATKPEAPEARCPQMHCMGSKSESHGV